MTIRKVVDNDRGAVSDEGSSGRINKEINNQKYLKEFVGTGITSQKVVTNKYIN